MQNLMQNSTTMNQQQCMPHPHNGIDFQPFMGLHNVWRRGLIVTAALPLCALYSFAVLRAVRPGIPRLLLGLPVLTVIHALPLLFHPVLEPLATISATFLAVRLTSGKVLAFILGRGVLVLPLSLLQFAAVMLAPFMPAQMVARQLDLHGQRTAAAAPPTAAASAPPPVPPAVWQQVTPMQRYSIDAKPSSHCAPSAAAATTGSGAGSDSDSAAATPAGPSCAQLWLRAANLLLNAAVAAAFAAYSCSSKQRLMVTMLHLGALGFMWRAMELLMLAASVPARDWLGITLAPHFRNPFAATSLTDFWARRWNITQGLVLRFFVYEPIVEGRLLPAAAAAPAVKGQPVAAAAASAASAAVAVQERMCQWPGDCTCRQHSRAQSTGHNGTGAAAADSCSAGAVGSRNSLLQAGSKPSQLAATSGLAAAAAAAAWPDGLRHRGSSRAKPWVLPTGGAAPPSAQLAVDARCCACTALSSVASSTDCNGSSAGGRDGCACSCQGGRSSGRQASEQQPQPGLHREKQAGRSAIAVGDAVSRSAAAAAGASSAVGSSGRSVPLLAGPSAAIAPRWRRQLAAAATFFVSGLEHELFMAYATRALGWRWLAFFSLQGLLLAVESGLKRCCSAAGLALHPAVASLAVLLVLGLAADILFWPVLVQPALVQPLLAAMPNWLLRAVGAPTWCNAA